MASGTAQVDEAALGEKDDVSAVLHKEPVNLGLDRNRAGGVGLEPRNINFAVEVTNVCVLFFLVAWTTLHIRGVVLTADDSIVRHLREVLSSQNISASSSRDEDLSFGSGFGHRQDLIARNCGLERVDGIDFGNHNASTHGAKGHSTALTDITETGDDSRLSGNHDISGALDAVDQRLAASVQVVELGLGNRVVDIDGRDEQLALLEHLVQVVYPSSGLLRDAVAVFEELGVLVVDKSGEIATVIKNEV